MKKITKALSCLLMVFSILALPFTNAFAATSTIEGNGNDIVDIAVKDGRFTTLVAALKAADLVEPLKEKGPFTVFAPTDDAFKKLPSKTLEDLLKPENQDALKDILLYHVTKGAVPSKNVVKFDGKTIPMLNKKDTKVTIKDGEVFINDSKVVITDIKADNGIIHVIDTVLIPQ